MGSAASHNSARTGDRLYRRPEGANEDGAATVRNILPWRNMEKELAKRLAAKAARGELPANDGLDAPPWRGNASEGVEPAPDSGVRSSVVDEPHRPLTYSVYTVSDLEARQHRMSMAAITVPAPSSWTDVRRSGLTLARTFKGWLLAKPRPKLRDVCQVPLIALFTDLKVALRQLPWRKIGWMATVAGGALGLLLFTVITVAELTDDLKPAHGVSYATAAESAAPPPIAPAVDDDSTNADNAPAIELDDEAAPAPPAPKAALKPKPKPGTLIAPIGVSKKPSKSVKPTGPQFVP